MPHPARTRRIHLAAAAAVLALLVTSCDLRSGVEQTAAPSPGGEASTTPAVTGATETSTAAGPAGATPTTAATPSAPAQVTPLLARALAEPVAVPASDGNTHLAYELLLTNVLGGVVTLNTLTVNDGDRQLLTLSGQELAARTRVLGVPATPTTAVGTAQSATIWLDVTLGGDAAAVPAGLTHTVAVTVSQPSPPLIPETIIEHGVAPVAVQTRKPIEIAPPLTGPNWLDGDSCCAMGAHRMALNPLDGQLWAAERFAIDYVQLDASGRMFSGDAGRLESYPYFGADIHAAGAGPVVAVVDGLPEQVPGRTPTGLPLDQYGGNHVVQDLGGGNYAFYAHLQTGSVQVKPGDQLSTGQVVGRLGNSGNSDAPHLHFHVMSTPDPLRSDGLPFVFDSFRLDSRVSSAAALDALLAGQPAPLLPGFTPRDETGVSPLALDVMTYADR